jgi:hypothetical protein
MSPAGLPPPPVPPPVPTSASAPSPPPVVHPPRPAWRQGHVGWTLLHLAIAWGIWFVGIIMWTIILEVVHEGGLQYLDEREDAAFSVAALIFGVGCLVGWLCFAYLRSALNRRWAALLGIAGGTWLFGLLIGVAGLSD